MRRWPGVVPLVLLLAVPLAAQQPTQSVRGTVRDGAGAPLPGAEVVIGRRSGVSNAEGAFVVDSVAPGLQPVAVRRIGYLPVRGSVEVPTGRVLVTEYILQEAPMILPTVVVDGTRPGIYGTVSIMGERPAPGARVQLVGPGGREVRTDSTGRFAFGNAQGGQYLVRVILPGFSERRVSVLLERDGGQELAINLIPSTRVISRGDAGAVVDLGKRLSFGLRDDRFNTQELRRYGTGDLCDLPRLRSHLGRDEQLITLILNGVTVYREIPVHALCSWRADEVELVEFGASVCNDRTGTIPQLLGAWCTGGGRRYAPPRSISGRGGSLAGASTGAYVVVWEKR